MVTESWGKRRVTFRKQYYEAHDCSWTLPQSEFPNKLSQMPGASRFTWLLKWSWNECHTSQLCPCCIVLNKTKYWIIVTLSKYCCVLAPSLSLSLSLSLSPLVSNPYV
jgi:hypothetical protein